MNRRKSAALLLSIAIHAAILAAIWLFMQKLEQKPQTASTAKRVELSLQDFITQPSVKQPVRKAAPAPKKGGQKAAPVSKEPPRKAASTTKETPSSTEREKPKPKKAERAAPKKESPSPLKKESHTPKKEVPKQSTKKAETKPHPITDSKPTTIDRQLSTSNEAKEPQKPKEQKPISGLSKLAGALGAPSMPQPTPPSPSIDEISDAVSNEEFKALYKDEFDRFTPDQKRFIKNNLSRIQGITQHYLTLRGYPYIAARLNQQGMNIVEFYLHPNGDITGLKVIESSGAEVLDQNSLDTIKTAYKDYPRPKEKTKIRFYIYYRLY